MHELIGKGVAEARRSQGLTQEQLARRFQGRGLTAWRKGTVGQLEAGLRKPRLDEVLLMAAALHVTVDELIPGGDDERVELGDGATVSPRWIREMLTGELHRDTPKPLADMPYAQFPVHKVMAQVMHRLGAEENRVEALVAPILKWADAAQRQAHERGLGSHIRDAVGYRTPRCAAARHRGIATEALRPGPWWKQLVGYWSSMTSGTAGSAILASLSHAAGRRAGGSSPVRCSPSSEAFLNEAYVGQEGDADDER